MAINSKARLFTPSVVRRLVSSSTPVLSQTSSQLSGSVIDDRTFRLDGPGSGLKSTQQLNIDWSKFENHTFFNSAEAKVNVSFDAIVNNFPFDGTKKELEDFFNRLTGYERYVFDLFPKSTGSLNFTGNEGNYVEVIDRAGALFPSLSSKKAEIVLDPGDNSITFETFLFIPSGVPRDPEQDEFYNENQIICQKLDAAGMTGFTLGLLDSRLKNRLIQETDNDGNRLWYVPSGDVDNLSTPDVNEFYDTLSAIEAGYTGVSSEGIYLPEDTWASALGYSPVLVEDKAGLSSCDLFFLVSSGSNYLSASMEIPKGKWTHVCATFDRSPGVHNLKLYLDGDLAIESKNSYHMETFSSALDESYLHVSIPYFSFSPASLTIGTGRAHFHGEWQKIIEADWNGTDSDHNGIPDNRYDVNSLAPSTQVSRAADNSTLSVEQNCFIPTQMFSGSLDEFRIWHSVRPSSVLKNLYGRNVYSDTAGNLRLYYKFNEGKGDYQSSDLLLDSSGNALHAKIEGYQIINRDATINKNPISGELGDPDDTIKSPLVYEKLSLNPVLFPSHPDVIELNKRLLNQASWYDTNNPNLITKLIPQHYLLEGQTENGFADMFSGDAEAYAAGPTAMPGKGQLSPPQIIQSILFTWARYFDEIKMFLDHFSNLLNVDYDSSGTIPDIFLPFLANYYGIKLPKTFTQANLEQYLDGENITPDQGISELSLQFVQNQIWRRILVNINEILQSKGTVHGIRALILSMGVSPDNLFRFREYGGSRTKTLDDVRRNRTEVAAMLDFSGTLAGVAGHRPAPGLGNPFYYLAPSLTTVNPWETDILDEIDDYTESPFITPFIMSPFLSGSRVEVGPCEPDTAIAVAHADITLDYSLPPDSAYDDTTPRYRESAGYLADSTLLDEKVIRLTDIDGNVYTLQFKGRDASTILGYAIPIDIIAIDDRIDIAQKIVDVVNSTTPFKAYNVSAQNNGIVRLYQPRGGRAGNYPIESLQVENDVLVPWEGLIQAVDTLGNKLWKVPDELGEIAQAKDIDGKLIYTPDSGQTFNNTNTDDPVYQFPLSAVGYVTNPQLTVLDKEGNYQIGVWRHAVTGEKITYEDHPDYGDTVFNDGDMGAPYEPVTVEQSEESYAALHGYVPVYNRKEYFSTSGFAAGASGFIKHDHPDLNEAESMFIKQNGSYHGFDATRGDGLFTSGSWTVEAIYKFEKPPLVSYPVTQSLMRLQSTYGDSENHIVLTNLVCMREPIIDQNTGKEIITRDGTVKLFVRPELSVGSIAKELVLEVTGVNVVDGQKWNISYGRERADHINSVVSSSYFLRVSKNNRGEISEYYEDRKYFLETVHSDGKTFWSDYDDAAKKNKWGTFITIGSQSLPNPTDVGSLGLNTLDASEEKACTNFSGKISQLRFWSKALTTSEFKEHVRNHTSLGVDNPISNFNFATSPVGSWEKLRLDISFDQPTTASLEDEAADQAFRDASLNPLGWIELFDFSQATLSGSRGALWRAEDNSDEMKYHMLGYGFEADASNIKPERFDYQTIDPRFDEQSVDNKVRVRSFQYTHNIEEYQTSVAPVHEILPSETPSDDTRFSIDLSSYQALNDDIVKIFATLESLDNIIGSPEFVFTQSYPDLEFLREVYFNRLENKVKIRSFFEFFKWFDNTIGDFIKTLVPRKTHFMGVNFIIESHMLERAKMMYNYSDVYLGDKNRHGSRGTITLQQFTGQVKRF